MLSKVDKELKSRKRKYDSYAGELMNSEADM